VPAAVPDITADVARAAAASILEALGYVGVIGVEFFVLDDGSVLVNEIAPRVHNSGHWTEAACVVSQFEQHVRAIAGLPLGDTRHHSACVMENLIGDDVARVPELVAEPDVLVHLYGKAEARPGRKMGHFTRQWPCGVFLFLSQFAVRNRRDQRRGSLHCDVYGYSRPYCSAPRC
jgi:5-(carboxyamino)imidazole ribonucleotide synthase